MPTPVFPYTLSTGDQQASAQHTRELEDPSMSSPIDGGYVSSRAKFTRAPRKKWSSGFTYINDTARAQLEAFWATVQGGSVIFQWRNQQDGQDYMVRFVDGPLKFEYCGNGTNQRWNVRFAVQEA